MKTNAMSCLWRLYRVKKQTKAESDPVGGLQEIGKNMTVIEYGDEMLVVDCGLSFS